MRKVDGPKRNLALGRARNAVEQQRARISGLEQAIAGADARIAPLERSTLFENVGASLAVL